MLERRERAAQLSADDVALVLQRAAELDQRDDDESRFDPAVLEEVAEEAGLPREAVRQAIAELRAGALTATEPTPTGWVSVVRHRVAPGPTQRVLAEAERFLTKQLFTPRRRQPTWSVWVPRQGLRADIARSTDFNGRLRLDAVDEVALAVVEEPGDEARVHVRIELRRRVRRAARVMAIASGGAAAGGAGAAAVVVAGIDPLLLAAGVPALAGAAGSTRAFVRVRRRHDRVLLRATSGVELFLDDLELRSPHQGR